MIIATSVLKSSHHLRPRPKGAVRLACLLGPLLLALSTYGFWQWIKLAISLQQYGFAYIFYLMTLAVLPLVLFAFLVITAAQRIEYDRLSSSYQLRLDQLQKRLNAQEDFLHVMTDHNPEALAIFDQHNDYWFVNQSAARYLGVDAKEVIGKSAAKFIGLDRGRKLEARLNEVRSTGRPLEILHQLSDDKGKTFFMQAHYELIESFGNFSGGIMVRAEDVTSLVVERERRETMLRQVIGTLVAVVDRRDPYASGHSARVGQLSRAIAEELVLNEKDIEASEIAGSLMNFGKVLVPREILTKTTALTPEELKNVRDSILTSADILSIIDFTGPVVPTLKQVLERYDGTGAPRGLKGNDILMTARIVTVANAYVALVSPRAHRPSLAAGEAMENMKQGAGKSFDPGIVTVLARFIETRGGKLDWMNVTKQA